jgi:hypothetical protein
MNLELEALTVNSADFDISKKEIPSVLIITQHNSHNEISRIFDFDNKT